MKNNILLLFLFILFGCKDSKQVDFDAIPVSSSNGFFNAVIEIPSGTNKKYEYNHDTKTFEQDIKNGKKRVVEFLSYPGNYGFIPNTMSDKQKGGDGDPIDILVLSESVPTGTVLEVMIIGAIELIDEGEIDTKIIAIPKDKDLRVLDCISLTELKTKYPEALQIIKTWFTSYDKNAGTFIQNDWSKSEAVKMINSYK